MAAAHLRSETLEERLIFWAIVLTWAFWSLGALYLVAPVLGWSMLAISLGRYLGFIESPHRKCERIPWDCAIWLGAMTLMLVALIAGHVDFGLGSAALLKSSIGWMKGWALLGVFICIGATMPVRPAIVYRASAILSAQTLAITPIFLLAFFAGVPRTLYISPLEIVGGPGPEFFRVAFYIIGGAGDVGGVRLGYYAPWAPAAALVASVSFILALFEKDTRWKTIGLISACVMCLLSQSRMSFVSIPVTGILVAVFSNLTRPLPYFALLAVLLAGVPLAEQIQIRTDDAVVRFNSARAASSRVRATLQTIARHRWETEAPVFGHGVVERGPHLVEYMPIGSHHSWNGLLYVKGIVGVIALATPFAMSILVTIFKCQADRNARAALGILLTLLVFSFGENLEILAYLFWPGLVTIGISMRRRFVNPFRRYFSGAKILIPGYP